MDSYASIELPKFKNLNINDIYNYEDNIVDFESLEDLDRSTKQARLALFKTTNNINKYERKAKEAKINYERKFRRSMIESTEKTEGLKRIHASLACEDLENDYLAYDQIKGELERLAYSLRIELQALQSMGNNLRQQMRVL